MNNKKIFSTRTILSVVAVVLIAGLSYLVYRQRVEQKVTHALWLTEKAYELMDEGDVALAQLLLLEALPEHQIETEVALRQSLTKNTLVLQESEDAEILAISEDGAYIAGVGGYPEREMMVWKSANGELIWRIPLSGCAEVCFSGKDTLIVADGVLQVCDIQKKRVVRKFKAPSVGNVSHLCADQRGRFVIITSIVDGFMCALDMNKGSYFTLIKGASSYIDGQFINDSVFMYDYSNHFRCLNLYDKKLRRIDFAENEYVWEYNEEYIHTYDHDTKATNIYTIDGKRQVFSCVDHVRNTSLSQISPSGRYFAMADIGRDILVYDLQTKELCRRIECHHDMPILNLSFDGVDDRFECITYDEYEWIWPDGDKISYKFPYTPYNARATISGKLLMVDCESSRSVFSYIYDLDKTKCVFSTSHIKESVEGGYLLYGREKDKAVVLRRTKEKPLPAKVYKIAEFESDYNHAFACFAGANHMMYIREGDIYYDLEGDSLIPNRHISGEYVGYTTNPDLMVTLKKGLFHIWDPHKGKLLKKVGMPKKGEDDDTYGHNVFFDGKEWVVTYAYSYQGDDEVLTNKVKCHLDTKNLTIYFVGEEDFSYSLGYNPDPKTSYDGRWRGTNVDGQMLYVDDAEGGELYRKMNVAPYNCNGYSEFAFSPVEGKVCVLDNFMEVYDIVTGKKIRRYDSDNMGYNIVTMAFSCDGKSIYYVNGVLNFDLRRVEFESVDEVARKVRKSLGGMRLTEEERRRNQSL